MSRNSLEIDATSQKEIDAEEEFVIEQVPQEETQETGSGEKVCFQRV